VCIYFFLKINILINNSKFPKNKTKSNHASVSYTLLNFCFKKFPIQINISIIYIYIYIHPQTKDQNFQKDGFKQVMSPRLYPYHGLSPLAHAFSGHVSDLILSRCLLGLQKSN
jgi:hypothetical protein